jgi:uncharacterized protein YbbC (DUF1343 family)
MREPASFPSVVEHCVDIVRRAIDERREGHGLACVALSLQVTLGIDELLDKRIELVEGRRVGLITNPSGVDGRLVPTADRLARDGRVELVQLWGPEHGIRGDAPAGDAVADAVDLLTGVPVESLYGSRRRPSPESLARVDLVLFDIQDVGSRTYTYVSTLGEAMRACADAKKPLVVLDRPNPLGGLSFEGAYCEPEFRSFIGWGPMPITHGLTVGEVARLFRSELAIACELEVVAMRGWRREMAWNDTGLRWTPTSPHIPHASSAYAYVATGMVASITRNVSDGVGSTLPFEVLAAEFADGPELAAELTKLALPGVRFQPIAVRPFYGKFQGRALRGVRLVIDDPRAYRPLRTALAFLVTLQALYGDRLELADETAIGKHWGTARLGELVRARKSIDEIEATWKLDLERFAAARAKVLLY